MDEPLISSFTFTDGSTVDLRVFPSDEATQTMLFLPALGVRASYYDELLGLLAKQGYNLLSADWRGMESSSVRPSRKQNWGYDQLVLDSKELFDQCEKLFPQTKLTIGGHSLGGQVATLFAARWPKKVDKMLLIATCMVWWRGYPGIKGLGVWLISWLFPAIAGIRGFFPGKAIGFGGKEARRIMQDWGRNGRKGTYHLLQSKFDYEAGFPKANPRILALSFDRDVYAPAAAMKLLIDKFPQQNGVSSIDAKGKDYGFTKLGHFNWVKKPQPWVSIMDAWLKEKSISE